MSEAGAVVSRCGRYRYRLWRTLGPGPTIAWVGLNPSTANATVDDPTLRRILAFSRGWGFGRVELLNLFAWRATDPRALATAVDPVGPETDAHLSQTLGQARTVVACWGTRGTLNGRNQAIYAMLPSDAQCLGHTRDGHPRHPLYVAASTPLSPLRRPNTAPE